MDPRYVTDWAAIIDGLRRRGMTFSQLAYFTGIPHTTLIRFRDGATPKHPDGEKLIDFWCYLTCSNRDQAPATVRLLNGNARK